MKMVFYWIFGVIGVFLLCLTGCESGSESDSLGASDGNGIAIFAYSQDCNNYFSKHAYSHLGETTMSGQWDSSYYWDHMTKFNVGDQQYIMGHHKYDPSTLKGSNDWWIRRIYKTGDLGQQTDSGVWSHRYQTLTGCKSGNNSFIIGQSSDTKRWFVQQVLTGGKLGDETSSGTWYDYYPVAVPLEMNGNTFIYFQSSRDESSRYYWFIAKLTETGHLHQTDDGYWNNLYHAHTSFEIDGIWYIFGIRKPTAESKGVWFIQHVFHDGTMGNEMDNGKWDYFYQTIASYRAENGKTYILSHNAEYNFWHIHEVHSGGTMGSETDSGVWDNYCEYVFPVSFNTVYLRDDNWMTAMNDTIGPRKLINITLPGSHDAGVNEKDYNLGADCFSGACSCNTTAQETDIIGQLERGSRYFDIRPSCMESNKKEWASWLTAHLEVNGSTILGCQSESMSNVFADVSDFFANGAHNQELVILKISHCIDVNCAEGQCDGNDFDLLVSHIKKDLPNLVKCDDNCNLMDMTLDEILEKGNVIVLVDEPSGISVRDKANGIFSWSDDMPIYDEYSNTDDLDTMTSDQLSKLKNSHNHKNKLFLLSWTLTMTEDDAIACIITKNSILNMALQAREALFPTLIGGWVEKGTITQEIYPNILYLDAFQQLGTRAAIYLNLYD